MRIHITHFILAKLNISMMYIRNRPNVENQDNFKNITVEEHSKIIKRKSNEHGFSELYGLGVSYGGYKMLAITHNLNLKKILNLSGFAINMVDTSVKNNNYSNKNILSILSTNDKIDKKNFNSYKKENFNYEYLFRESKTHGTFTASFLESKLRFGFNWLCQLNI